MDNKSAVMDFVKSYWKALYISGLGLLGIVLYKTSIAGFYTKEIPMIVIGLGIAATLIWLGNRGKRLAEGKDHNNHRQQ